jgi:hypothetical protein
MVIVLVAGSHPGAAAGADPLVLPLPVLPLPVVAVPEPELPLELTVVPAQPAASSAAARALAPASSALREVFLKVNSVAFQLGLVLAG